MKNEALRVEKKVKKLTVDFLRNCSGSEYNHSVWNKNIDNYLNTCTDVEFYLLEKGGGFDYDRYFVVYTTNIGIRFMNRFSYSHSITDGGFYQTIIIPELIQRDGFADFSDTDFIIINKNFKDAAGNYGALGSSSRGYMAEMSKKYGDIFTKELYF